MQIQTFEPSPVLKSTIDGYTVIETEIEADTVVIPHLGFVLAIQYRGQVSLQNEIGNQTKVKIPDLVLSGIRNSSRKFCYNAGTGTILVQFRELGVSSIFRQSLPEFFEHFELVEDLFAGSDIPRWHDQICNAVSNEERITIVEQWLISKLIGHEMDRLVDASVSQIQLCSGIISVRSLAQSYDLSIDTFEKRFRKIVGATPKQFANIVRMKSLIADKYNSKSLTELAYKYEYYDQSHFIKQFRSFTGQSPKEFFKTPYCW